LGGNILGDGHQLLIPPRALYLLQLRQYQPTKQLRRIRPPYGA
jgi:hypothetical protein